MEKVSEGELCGVEECLATKGAWHSSCLTGIMVVSFLSLHDEIRVETRINAKDYFIVNRIKAS